MKKILLVLVLFQWQQHLNQKLKSIFNSKMSNILSSKIYIQNIFEDTVLKTDL